MKKQDASHNTTITVLRKHLLRHVHDMQLWRVNLESDREYQADKVKIPEESSISKLGFAEQIDTLDKVTVDENKLLEALLREREKEVVEVVSVNMGKKKKRFKKGAELEAEQQEEEAPKSARAGAKTTKTTSTTSVTSTDSKKKSTKK